MKMKTQLTLAAVVAAGLVASGCSQQMVAQQAAEQVVDVAVADPAPQTVVKTIVDCSKCKQAQRPRPRPRPTGNRWSHTHPAVPRCTDSTTHVHKYTNRKHSHKYSCRKPVRRAPPPRMAPPPPRAMPAPPPRMAPRVNPNAHTHPAVPKCTNSVRHVHPSGNRPHSHRYSCRKAAPPRRRVSGHTHPAVPNCTDSVTHNHKTARGGNHSHRYACSRPQRPQPRRPVVVQPPRQYQPVMPVMPKVKAKGTYRGPIKIDGMMQQYQSN